MIRLELHGLWILVRTVIYTIYSSKSNPVQVQLLHTIDTEALETKKPVLLTFFSNAVTGVRHH